MLENYFAAAVRNLFRNRINTLISVFGLFLGFTATILIALYVRDEYSYDRFFTDHDRIYQIGETVQPPGSAVMRASATSVTDAPALRLAFPEIDLTTRLASANVRLRRTGTEESVTLVAHWVDPTFFELFRLPLVSGSLNGALSQPDTVVVTRKAARQLFGDIDPIGRTIEVIGQAFDEAGRPLGIERTDVMRVIAIVENLPANSHLDLEVFLPGVASFSALSVREVQSRSGGIRSENVYTYVRLSGGANIKEVRFGLRAFVDKHIPGIIDGMRIASFYTFTLVPLADIHFLPPSMGAMKPTGDPRIVQAFIGIALLILVVGCGNFVSMMTARATRRAIEVGIRKTSGATRRHVMVQFLAESLLYTALALIAAVIAVNLLLPAFNGILRREISFDLNSNLSLTAGIATLGVLVGLVAGAYPAVYLSRFRPSVVLKGIGVRVPSSSGLRQGLVVFQFATLIALMVATVTIYRQTEYAIEDRLRLPTDEIYFGGRSITCSRAVVESIHAIPGVRAASCASTVALAFENSSTVITLKGSTVTARLAPIDPAFVNLFDIQPVAGRLLSIEHGADDLLRNGNDIIGNPALIINESAARALGFASPNDAIGQFPRWVRVGRVDGQVKMMQARSSEIVGVIPDFSIGSVREAIAPTVYYLDPVLSVVLVLKFNGDAIQEGLAAVTHLWAQKSSVPFNGKFLNQFINDLYADVATQSTILAVFSGVAVVLSSLGILGLAMFAAERRTKEIGLRKVMGALRADILILLGWQFARPVLLANFIAWPVAYWVLKNWLEGFAYHVELGPSAFLIAGLLALVIALASVAAHALLVARAKPVAALRHE